ncbi:hypothetical protein OKA04_19075 [Luteolibacter flavescens]|uniref:Uncharacterized protein n=1 Tax=Luteolibacter flavescens TaxID=1859460 RepID=A0ABT3FUF4_9BACT|nr:hypothetical protein [Luteolibacter flavescens]MCW1886851.1 hypothetical protein [Luteolibacter flavescens]
MLASNLPAFHRWFLAPRAAAPGVVLHGFPHLPSGLAPAIARYLNEFDDDAGGNWTAFAPELIQIISETPPQRSLLGLGEGCKNCPANSPCGRRKVLGALARKGHAVLDGPLAVEACADISNVFRVSLGPAPADGKGFHLILRPELFSDRSLPSIIGDTYLEWITTREMADTV